MNPIIYDVFISILRRCSFSRDGCYNAQLKSHLCHLLNLFLIFSVRSVTCSSKPRHLRGAIAQKEEAYGCAGVVGEKL